MENTLGLTRANRFIIAYNIIDSTLRNIYDFKRNVNYSDMIRRAASLNYVVKKYEDKLIDYGRLRNAIIHGSNDENIIAEPHEDVVSEYEKIAKLLSTPPKALNTIATRQVMCMQDYESIKKVIGTMCKYGYKNIPIYSNGMLLGIANAGRICLLLGEKGNEGENIDSFSTNTTIGEIMQDSSHSNYFEIVEKDISIESALNMFYKNKKLVVILITENGNYLDKPLGIITIADTMDMNKILDIY